MKQENDLQALIFVSFFFFSYFLNFEDGLHCLKLTQNHICMNLYIVTKTWIAHKVKNNSWHSVSRVFQSRPSLKVGPAWFRCELVIAKERLESVRGDGRGATSRLRRVRTTRSVWTPCQRLHETPPLLIWTLVDNFKRPLGVKDLETGQWWDHLLRGRHQELIRGRDSEKPLE